MVDSRQKGRTAELNCRNELRKLTNLNWERTPMSGALGAQHKLKGDLYVPDTPIKYCAEVKHYKDDHISTKLLTGKNPQFNQWWEQTIREAKQIDKEPLLVFKHDRSKWFAAFDNWDIALHLQEDCRSHLQYIFDKQLITICLLTEFCRLETFEL